MTAHTSPKLRENPRLLQGRAKYVDDIHLDGMVHAAFVRSPMAHARILSINTAPALEAGALLVLTAADLPFNDRPWVVRYWHPAIRGGMPKFLATDRVRFVGEPIALVIASSRYLAEDFAALVEVDYDPLPALSSMESAMREGAPQLHPDWNGNIAANVSYAHGDARAALAPAVHRVKRSFEYCRQTPVALEGRGVVADFDQQRQRLTAWISTQAHYNVRQNLSTLLDLPEYQVRVICEDVGGGFGAKSRTYAEEILISHASRCLARPVKWIEDRFENLQTTTHSRAVTIELELGADAEGRILGMLADVKLDLGGYVFTSGIMTAEVSGNKLMGGYKVPAFAIDVSCIGTNKTPIATYRGAGQPEATFPMECLLDVLAKQIGISEVEIRLRNLVAPADLPYNTRRKIAGVETFMESGDFPGLLNNAIAESGYNRDVVVEPDGRHTAWGLAFGVEGSGVVNLESADIRIDTEGNVTIFSGMTSQGQGHRTTYSQVCAEALGAPFDKVDVQLGDTSLVPFGRGAFATRGAVIGANAVYMAALELKAKALGHAAALLQTDASELDVIDGEIVRKSGESTDLTLADIAKAVQPGGQLFAGEAALQAVHIYKSNHPLTIGGTVHLAKVSLDRRTGFFEVVDYFVMHDAGRTINAMVVDGQIIGGAVDGIGGAILSELVYDTEAQPLSSTLADYMVATAPDVPRIRMGEMETRPGTNPLGVRGIGESGVIPAAPAIANALVRAIKPDGTGHEDPLFTLPLKPERVFAACRAADKAAAAPSADS